MPDTRAAGRAAGMCGHFLRGFTQREPHK